MFPNLPTTATAATTLLSLLTATTLAAPPAPLPRAADTNATALYGPKSCDIAFSGAITYQLDLDDCSIGEVTSQIPGSPKHVCDGGDASKVLAGGDTVWQIGCADGHIDIKGNGQAVEIHIPSFGDATIDMGEPEYTLYDCGNAKCSIYEFSLCACGKSGTPWKDCTGDGA